jgi:cytochrome c553
MRFLAGVVVLSLLPAAAIGADAQLQLPQEDWAFPVVDPAQQPAGAGGGGGRGGGGRAGGDAAAEEMHTVPGSTQKYTQRQVTNMAGLSSWFPEEEGPMPDVISKGRAPDVRACAGCHLTGGTGHATAGMAAGMNPDYFFQAVKDLAAGDRNPRAAGMMGTAKALTDDEIRQAAAYYGRQKPRKWVKVIESATVPATYVQAGAGERARKPEGGTEPIGMRVIEIPEDEALFALRDPHSGYVAYVPPGSIKKGEALVTTGGNGKTIPCAVCHGPDLKGLGTVPGIGGRLPTYVARQMIDIRNGYRKAGSSALMKAVVEKLTIEDIVNIVAYTASRDP